ncbi:MAG: hypothetical protein IJ705_06950 [Oscillospiraceae bacterium]|nr:hypothetical protein [Oscillospiraceae bacterium]
MSKLGIAIAAAAVVSFGASTGFFALMNNLEQSRTAEAAVEPPAAVVATARPEPVIVAAKAPVSAPTPTPTPAPSAAPEASPAQPSPGFDPALNAKERIERIREWYRAAYTLMSQEGCTYYGQTAAALWHDGELVYTRTHETHPAANGNAAWTTTYQCYFVQGKPYFMVIQDREAGDGLLRLYFWDGALIRWVEPNGETFDGANANYVPYRATAEKIYSDVRAMKRR